MRVKSKEYALVIKHLKNGTTEIDKVEMQVDRTRRPVRPEIRRQIEAKYGKQSPPPKKKRKK